MKRAAGLILALVVLISMAACGKQEVAFGNEESSTDAVVSFTRENGYETTTEKPSYIEQTQSGASDKAEEDGVCYLPSRIINATVYSEEGAEKLGKEPGYHEEVFTEFEYDDAGRLITYDNGETYLSLCYLDGVGLPSVYRNNEGTVYFTAHRWSDDRSEILTDVSYSGYTPYNMADYETGSVLQEDYRVSRIRQDNDGRLISAEITWKSNFGEEAFCYNGHTFDDKGCLMFVSATYEDSDYFEEFVHNYGSDGRISGYDYYIKNGSEVPTLSERVVVEPEEYISFSNVLKEDKFEYTGDGCYRMEISGDYGTNWYEIELDENGKISQYSWHMGVSGMTYIEKIEYKEMPLTEYEGTPVCYSDLYPLFRTNALGDESYVKNAGELQVPLAAKLFFDMY